MVDINISSKKKVSKEKNNNYGQSIVLAAIIIAISIITTSNMFQINGSYLVGSSPNATVITNTVITDPLDEISNSVITIDFSHHEIHEGDSFILSDQQLLNNGNTYDYILNTSNMSGKQVHLIVLTRGTGEANLFIYENVTYTGGVLNGEVNRNRNSLNINKATIIENVNIVSRGIKILEEHFGAGKNIGCESRNALEFILQENTTYSIEFTSESVQNDISWLIEWYEHTPSQTE